MSTRTEYGFEEWQELRVLACSGILYKMEPGAGKAHQMPDSISGVVILIRELLALGSFLSKSMEKYGQYEMLSELITDLKENGKTISAETSPVSVADLDNLVERVNQILALKAREEEAQAYRAFVYELAYEVANASGDGFFGTGTKINAKEAEFLQNLKALLLDKKS